MLGCGRRRGGEERESQKGYLFRLPQPDPFRKRVPPSSLLPFDHATSSVHVFFLFSKAPFLLSPSFRASSPWIHRKHSPTQAVKRIKILLLWRIPLLWPKEEGKERAAAITILIRAPPPPPPPREKMRLCLVVGSDPTWLRIFPSSPFFCPIVQRAPPHTVPT